MGEYAELEIDHALANEDCFYGTGMTEGEYQEHYGDDWPPEEPMSSTTTKKRPRKERLTPCRMLWETREGKRIRVCSMPDNHLINAILYVERNALLLQANDMMSDIEREFGIDVGLDDCAVGQPAEEFLVNYVPYRKLYNEGRRRGLVLVPVNQWFSWAYDCRLPDSEG